MTTQTFSKKAALLDAWTHFKTHPFTVVSVFVVTVLVSLIMGVVVNTGDVTPTAEFVLNIFDFILEILVSMGAIYILLRIHDNEPTSLADLFVPVPFLGHYIMVSIMVLLLVTVGLALFVVPGIIFMVAFSMAPYLVVDKGLGAIEAMKESYRITEGHRWNLYLLSLLLVGFNILGVTLAGVGLVVTVPLSMLAMVYVYRLLEHPRTDDMITLSFWSKASAVAVTLVGIIVGVLLAAPMLFPQFFVTPDDVRAQDLTSLQLSLSLYHDANDFYPPSLESLVPTYINALPVDPESFIPYTYEPNSDGSDYALCTVPVAPTDTTVAPYCTSGAGDAARTENTTPIYGE